MTVTFTIHGTAQVRSALVTLGLRMKDRGAAAILAEAEVILQDAKDNYVPVREGILSDSGRVELRRRGFWNSAHITFGGAARAYAVAVHEHPSGASPPSWLAAGIVTFNPPGRGPKYLERPLRKATKGLATRLARRMRL